MRKLIEAGYESLGEMPVFLGETGIPMDMKCVLTQALIESFMLIATSVMVTLSRRTTLYGKQR